MSKPDTILVRAGAGKVVMFPSDTLVGPGLSRVQLVGAGVRAPDDPGDPPVTAKNTRFLRMRLRPFNDSSVREPDLYEPDAKELATWKARAAAAEKAAELAAAAAKKDAEPKAKPAG